MEVKKMNKEVTMMGGKELEVLAVKYGGASYLQYRLCRWGNEYVTWCYNTDFSGYNHGHYFMDLEDAKRDFDKRG